jgi:hypothetical protein
MKSMKSLRYYSLALCSVLIIAVSCKKSSNSNSNPAPGTMTADVNGQPTTFVITTDTSQSAINITALGLYNGTKDTLSIMLGYENYSATYFYQYPGSYSDTLINFTTANNIWINGGLQVGPATYNIYEDWFQGLTYYAGLYGTIVSVTATEVTGNFHGTIYLNPNAGNTAVTADSLVITNGKFVAKF